MGAIRSAHKRYVRHDVISLPIMPCYSSMHSRFILAYFRIAVIITARVTVSDRLMQ